MLHSAEMRVQNVAAGFVGEGWWVVGWRGGKDRILGRIFLLPREQTMVSWNNAADESLSKENKALTSWVLKAHS